MNGELLAYPFLQTSGDPALQTLFKEDADTQMIHAFLVLAEYDGLRVWTWESAPAYLLQIDFSSIV